MKGERIIDIIFVCLMVFLLGVSSCNTNVYKDKYESMQLECDSLQVLLNDIKRDTSIYKLIKDYPYRVKVLTVVNNISDKELLIILNRK